MLLYLLLVAYLDQNVAKGWNNPRVKAWLEDAKRSGAFKSGAQMLHSPNEFFGSSAGTVLYGRWPAEPFERAKVRDALPAFYDWVVSELVTDGVLNGRCHNSSPVSSDTLTRFACVKVTTCRVPPRPTTMGEP